VREAVPFRRLQLQGAGQCLDDLFGRPGRAALFQADEVVHGKARQRGEFLAAQSGGAAPLCVGGRRLPGRVGHASGAERRRAGFVRRAPISIVKAALAPTHFEHGRLV
jgi:hypothetical protein